MRVSPYIAISAVIVSLLGPAAACETRDSGSDAVAEDDPGKVLAEEWGIPHPMVIAHRGASGIAPESTRAAYEIARDLGADYLEADIQQTADGRLVVFHDDAQGDNFLTRTSNVEHVFDDERHRDEVRHPDSRRAYRDC